MSKMSELHALMIEEIGEDPTTEEIDQWFDNWCQENLPAHMYDNGDEDIK